MALRIYQHIETIFTETTAASAHLISPHYDIRTILHWRHVDPRLAPSELRSRYRRPPHFASTSGEVGKNRLDEKTHEHDNSMAMHGWLRRTARCTVQSLRGSLGMLSPPGRGVGDDIRLPVTIVRLFNRLLVSTALTN